MITRIHFNGPAKYRLRIVREFCGSVMRASIRRILKGPRRPGWNWFVELATEVMKARMATLVKTADVNESRRYLDAVTISLPETADLKITTVAQEKFRGSWFTPESADPGTTVLYFHGGGYSFYPKAYAAFIGLVAQATKSRTFALDYSLTPEHRFPSQLEEALDAYRWLLDNDARRDGLVVAGDSAGGNLALALCLAVRDLKLPPPALAICLSPPTDFETERAGLLNGHDSDWIAAPMLFRWADWFCDAEQRRHPLISPVLADLRGLPPIYIQAGRAEVLFDSIQLFADRAKEQGADVVLESWEDMNHDFQFMGRYAPQSMDALRHIGEVVDVRVRMKRKPEIASI